MKATREQQKQAAIKAMQKLEIFAPYINAFKAQKQRVCEFENFGGFYIENDSKLSQRIAEIEAGTGCMVYAVIKSTMGDMEMVNYLIVSSYEDDIGREVESCGKYKSVFAYVENITYPDGSEMGMIGIQSFCGGIRRVW